jgi:DNA modification methylase
MELNKIYQGNSFEILKTFPNESIDCCITSPPYWGLRDYNTAKWVGGDSNCNHMGDNKNKVLNLIPSDIIYKSICKKCGARIIDEQLGLEETPELYVENMVNLFKEVKRVLKPNGTLWLNLGDSYWGGGWKGSKTDLNGTKQGTNVGTLCGKNLKPDGKHLVLKPKDLVGIPWKVAFALQADGWWLRQDIIWNKPNPMPESVTDRCTKSHEYIFLLSKSQHYYYDSDSIKEKSQLNRDWTKTGGNLLGMGIHKQGGKMVDLSEGRKHFESSMSGGGTSFINHSGYKKQNGELICGDTRNKRSVWTVNTKPFKDSHFATFPEELIIPMIKAGCPEVTGIVLDPFMGAGTTGVVSKKLNRNFIGIELNPEYIKMAEKRIKSTCVPYKLF